MPAGRVLACEPDGPLGTNAPRAIGPLRRMLLGGNLAKCPTSYT
jgi:hypothetical protein